MEKNKSESPKNNLLLQSSPHISSPVNTSALMRNVGIALAPVAVFGVVVFGLPALLNIIVAVGSAIAAEKLFRLITKQPIRAGDYSAGISGLLLALVNPPGLPLWMTALGAVFAVIVAKEFFGGLGANVFNPALIGRAFLMMSFPAELNTYSKQIPHLTSFAADVGSSATPLGIAKEVLFDSNAANAIAEVGNSLVDAGAASSDSFLETIKTLFFGFKGGSLGEVSIFLILAGCLFLIVTKTIDARTTFSMIAAGFLCAFALWQDLNFAVFSLLTGGLIFGAVFMVTDYVTSPVTGKGKIIFGAGVGIIAMLIRKWGTYPEGVCFAILIMNAVVPFLNKLLSKKYGYVKPKKADTPQASAVKEASK